MDLCSVCTWGRYTPTEISRPRSPFSSDGYAGERGDRRGDDRDMLSIKGRFIGKNGEIGNFNLSRS